MSFPSLLPPALPWSGVPSPIAAEAIAHFDSLLAGAFPPDSWWEAYIGALRRHGLADDPLQRWALRPFLIDEPTYQGLVESLGPVVRGFAAAADRLAADPALRRKLGVPEYLEPLLEIDRSHGRASLAARLDGIPTDDGRLWIIEYNSEPQTAPFQYEVERAFEGLPIAAEFARRHPVRTVDLYGRLFDALAARGRARGAPGLPTIAVLDKRLWLSRLASSFRPLMYASARGCTVVYVDPDELEYRSGSLRAAGTPIDLVAFVGWSLLINDRRRLAQIVRAISEQAVGVVGGLSRGLLSSYKFVFELLSAPEYREMYPPEVASALASHIPWTRVLRERETELDGAAIDLVPFLSRHRERFVLKPAGGGGGGNVIVGDAVSEEEWTSALGRGLAQRTIVQERVVPERQRFALVDGEGRVEYEEMNCEFSPYVWGGDAVEGAVCRVAAGPVISAERGSGITAATWIVTR
jgi:hypothetical protein